MKTKTLVALGSICGAFVLYCGEDAMNALDGGPGMVHDAGAQSGGGGCCAPLFSTISEGSLDNSDLATSFVANLDTSGVRTLVLYTEASQVGCEFSVGFQPTTSPDETKSIGRTVRSGETVPVLGPRAFLQLRDANSCTTADYHLLGLL